MQQDHLPSERKKRMTLDLDTTAFTPFGKAFDTKEFRGERSPSRSNQCTTSSTNRSPTTLFSEYHSDHRFAKRSRASTAMTTTSTAPTSPSAYTDEGHCLRPRCHEAPAPTDPVPAAPPPNAPAPSLSPTTSLSGWSAKHLPPPSPGSHTSDLCPDLATLAAVRSLPIYSGPDRSIAFGSLFAPATATHPRQLLVFIRHFFCGACQAYVRALTAAIPLREYFGMPAPTSIVVIGCGAPELLARYKAQTACPWPLYTDPSREIFRKLGMGVTLNALGARRPDYMREISPAAWMGGQLRSVVGSLRSRRDGPGAAAAVRKRDVLRGGNVMQVGGEFLFEDGEVVWCHRMRSYRGHAEVAEVRRILGLDE